MIEEALYSPKVIQSLMGDRAFQKKWGQNFLIDGNTVRAIVERSGLKKGDRVLEIGPGVGTLTQEMLKSGLHVTAVEIDARLHPILEENFEGEEFRLIKGDALKISFEELFEDENIHVIANLPYYVTTPLIKKLLRSDLSLSTLTLMVQKEVALRMTADPGTKDYGSLTLFIALYADCEVLLDAPKTMFLPRPKVDSKVVLLRKKEDIPENHEELAQLFQKVFMQRRKKLLNGLVKAFGVEKNALRAVFQSLNLREDVRPEDVSLEEYVQIVKMIKKGL